MGVQLGHCQQCAHIDRHTPQTGRHENSLPTTHTATLARLSEIGVCSTTRYKVSYSIRDRMKGTLALPALLIVIRSIPR